MAINPVEGANAPQGSEAAFDAAVDNAQQEDALMERMMDQAMLVGMQFIIMPRAREILNEAMSDE